MDPWYLSFNAKITKIQRALKIHRKKTHIHPRHVRGRVPVQHCGLVFLNRTHKTRTAEQPRASMNIYVAPSISTMVLNPLPYIILSITLCCIGVLDMCLCIHVLKLSPCTACFCNGCLVGLFMLENWTLNKDIELKKQPDPSSTHQLDLKCQDIEALKEKNYSLTIEKIHLEHQVHDFERRITFEEWHRLWKLKHDQERKTPKRLSRSMSWRNMSSFITSTNSI